MAHEIRQRIIREATPEEKERHRAVREQIEQEFTGANSMVAGSSGTTSGSRGGRNGALSLKKRTLWKPSTAMPQNIHWQIAVPSFERHWLVYWEWRSHGNDPMLRLDVYLTHERGKTMSTRRTPATTTKKNPRRTRALRVKVVIHEAEEGGYWAEVPALPGCVTEGDTRSELLANLREAVEGCLLVTPGSFKPEPGGSEEEIEL